MRPKWLRNKKLPKSALEAAVVKAGKAAAKKAGFIHRKVKYEGRNGAPDNFFFGPNRTLIIIEFKAPGEEPEAHQWVEIKLLRKMGFCVFVVDNQEFARLIFDDY